MNTTWDDRRSASAAKGRRLAAWPAIHARAGFTLAELLIAVTLGAVLMVGTATAAGLFGLQVASLKQEVDDSKERAFSAIAEDLRYAWSVETPNSRTLRIFDTDGRSTVYRYSKGRIKVTQPDGSQGVLIDELRAASFQSETITRYREGTPLSRGGTIWSATAPMGTSPEATVLAPGAKLGLGFTAGSQAPVGSSEVPGIDEQLIDAALDTLRLEIGSIMSTKGKLYVDLYRARSPGDARPVGSSLGQMAFNTKGFKKVKAWVWDSKKEKKKKLSKDKPWGWWEEKEKYELVVKPPTKAVKLNVQPLRAKIQPGYAYTFVLQVAGDAGLALRSYTLPEAVGSGVAQAVSGGSLAESPLALECSLSGIVTVTRTVAKPVVERVRISIQGKDKLTVAGYASLASQSMIQENWLGSVPGELAP